MLWTSYMAEGKSSIQSTENYLIAALIRLRVLWRGPLHQIDGLWFLLRRSRLRLRPFRRRPISSPIERRRRRNKRLWRDDRTGPPASGDLRRGVDAAKYGANRSRDGVGPEAAEIVEVVKIGGPESGASVAVLRDVLGLGGSRVRVVVTYPLVAIGSVGAARFGGGSLSPAVGRHCKCWSVLHLSYALMTTNSEKRVGPVVSQWVRLTWEL